MVTTGLNSARGVMQIRGALLPGSFTLLLHCLTLPLLGSIQIAQSELQRTCSRSTSESLPSGCQKSCPCRPPPLLPPPPPPPPPPRLQPPSSLHLALHSCADQHSICSASSNASSNCCHIHGGSTGIGPIMQNAGTWGFPAVGPVCIQEKNWWHFLVIIVAAVLLFVAVIMCYKAIKRKPMRKEENGTSRAEYAMSLETA